MFFNDGSMEEEDGFADVERFGAWAQAFNSQFNEKHDEDDTNDDGNAGEVSKAETNDGDIVDAVANTSEDNEAKD